MTREIVALALQYRDEVRERKAFGDSKAEYNSQNPKIQAYLLLMELGLSANEVVNEFNRILAENAK